VGAGGETGCGGKYPTFSNPVILHTYSPMKMKQTECSEMLPFKLKTPVNNPEESIQQMTYIFVNIWETVD
jgi:hypothetical protein